MPNTFRVPYGPGWALVGDAGLVMDPITAQGISNAFRDAELLADAVVVGMGGRSPLESALAGDHRRRDTLAGPMYEFTVRLAALEPLPLLVRRFFRAVAERPDLIEQFLGAFAGASPIDDFLARCNVVRHGLSPRMAAGSSAR